jgi:hypothetical protein
MNGETTFHFSEACGAPEPWRIFDASGRRIVRPDTCFTVYRIPTGTRSPAARSSVRSFLSAELRRIAGRAIPLQDSAAGPGVTVLIQGAKVSISISYIGEEAWLALGWGGPIGIDAVEIEEIPEWDQVATTYLGPNVFERLRNSPERELDFARNWAGFEARLKLNGLSLTEGVEVPAAALCEARFGTMVVAVAVRPGRRRSGAGSDHPVPTRIAVSLLDAYRDRG